MAMSPLTMCLLMVATMWLMVQLLKSPMYYEMAFLDISLYIMVLLSLQAFMRVLVLRSLALGMLGRLQMALGAKMCVELNNYPYFDPL